MRLEELFNHRAACMGVAILWIMFFHAPVDIALEPLHILKLLGYGGVDIFIFASGVGCYYSLRRQPLPLGFLRRRAVRVLPTWFVFMFVWWRTLDVQGLDLPWQALLGNLLFVQAFTDWQYSFNWYMSALPLLYLLAPYFFALSARNFFIVELALILFTIPFLDQDYLIFVTRLPIFFAGFVVAARRSIIVDRAFIVRSLALTMLGAIILVALTRTFEPLTLSRFGLWWYPFLLITPGLCLALTLMCRRLPTLDRVLATLGGFSFELYLVHLTLINIANHRELLVDAEWIALFPTALLGAWGLRRLTNALLKGLIR